MVATNMPILQPCVSAYLRPKYLAEIQHQLPLTGPYRSYAKAMLPGIRSEENKQEMKIAVLTRDDWRYPWYSAYQEDLPPGRLNGDAALTNCREYRQCYDENAEVDPLNRELADVCVCCAGRASFQCYRVVVSGQGNGARYRVVQ